MAIFSDAAGFKYMGDCQWGTFSIDYPTQSYLTAYPHSAVSAELTALCTQSGLAFRNVASQANFDARPASNTHLGFMWFGANGDIDDRYFFGIGNWLTGDFTSNNGVLGIYNNTGSTATNNTPGTFDQTNRLYYLATGINSHLGATPPVFGAPSTTVLPIQWVGASDGQYLALFIFQRNFVANSVRSCFFYAGRLADINTGFSYYNASNITNGVTFCVLGATTVSSTVAGGHYIANTAKNLLQTGDAAYVINCSDGQNPTAQWGTDFYAFDNNTILGFPAIGRVRGMLLGTGTYILGQPAKIQGAVFPDGGSPWYLPVGTYAGKTLLMRCYSSMP